MKITHHFSQTALVIILVVIVGVGVASAQVIRTFMRASTVSLAVPFSSQAPYGVWDSIRSGACEEMSIIMVSHYLKGTPLTLSGADAEVTQMVMWERTKNYADDISMQQTADVALQYGLKSRIITNVTAESLKAELSAGNPVIVPVAGQELNNPKYELPGPPYHVLVVTGYNAKGLITNDPGTSGGESYLYPTDLFMSALHDWTGSTDTIDTGPKTALVLTE